MTFASSIVAALACMGTASAQSLPGDAKATCTVSNSDFKKWFVSGSPSLNGAVNPANSINFSNPVDNCPFYQWAEHMFMWLTSPAPAIYGGGARVFDTDVFYDITPPNGSGKRKFIQHSAGTSHLFALRAAQVGPHGLPALLDAQGRLIEVVTAPIAPSGNPLVTNAAGQQVEVKSVTKGPGNKAVLVDTTGKPINVQFLQRSQSVPKERIQTMMRSALNANPSLQSVTIEGLNSDTTVEKLVLGTGTIFVSLSGNVVEVEQGQADASVLLTHSNHLIYFAILANDVYAEFRTAVKDSGISPAPTQFPTTQSELNKIQTFATSHGKPKFTDGDALTIEIKTSWVDASTLGSSSKDYITTTGIVPEYDTSNPKKWKATGKTKTLTLALVGMHVVGSAKGHPEMIWATFEHKGNTPLATYEYISTTGKKTESQKTTGTWLFSASGSSGPFNNPHADYFSPPDITALSGFKIDGSDTLREKAFGGASNQTPNPLISSTADSNTQVISINNDVHDHMKSAKASADIRNNYIMFGATWTAGGVPPSTPFPMGNEVGTSLLTNTTMETYVQGPDTKANGTNCFSCHLGNMLGTSGGNGLSHVFGTVDPLF
jgi:hypothetical protein